MLPRSKVEKGVVIGWKSALTAHEWVIVKLRIGAKVRRVVPFPGLVRLPGEYGYEEEGKCRAESAKVLSITSIENGRRLPKSTLAHSDWDYTFTYRVGDTVRPRYPLSKDPNVTCASGIHFFTTRKEAVNYQRKR